ncbi:MAG: hypothetical protein RMI34_02900 [Chloroherpetonaceae bacterium]|nr:hypothetical protein [Chloroherpetonaceae bacterium]MCS7210584.1 hypothetical protein [Chloroherpetonaceae bacterium]MDW8019005.1 hypothetical protein [Chloroherpetonaceae bacterium]MDW8465590.1 hypothetical protein [Chloroherpetonaceae bacterium]
MLLGLLAHSVLGIIPLAYQAIAPKAELAQKLSALLWQLTLVFSTHLAMAAMNAFLNARWLMLTNLVISALFLLSNIAHPIAHLLESPIEWHQVALLTLIAALNLQLVLASLCALKSETQSPQPEPQK